MKYIMVIALAILLSACGAKVEVPPASVGKIMTKNGYKENVIPTSTFRLDACMFYCDRLVVMDVSDRPYVEPLVIFIPEDKLNLTLRIQATLSVNPNRTEELFNAITPEPVTSNLYEIKSKRVYDTYAQQIIQSEVREYLSKFSIAQIASSNEMINNDLRMKLSKIIEERTPFSVRYVGITNISYPDIIVKAQEAAAERREAIQQEEAQLKISKVRLDRELEEARLSRAIEKEKAETEALAQRTLADSVDPRVLELRKLENQRIIAEKWNGQMPTTIMGGDFPVIMQMPN